MDLEVVFKKNMRSVFAIGRTALMLNMTYKEPRVSLCLLGAQARAQSYNLMMLFLGDTLSVIRYKKT